MKFLLRTVGGPIRHGFAMEALGAIEYRQRRAAPMEMAGLKGIQFYLGDFEAFPDPAAMRGSIGAYGKAGPPAAYALDVCVDGQGRTKAMEVHDLYSRGLHGSSSRGLPYMMAKVFGDIRRKMIDANKD